MPLAVANGTKVSTSSTPDAGDLILPVPFVSQQPYKDLCWAACGAMILKYYKVSTTLGEIASKVLGLNCNVQPIPTVCDTVAWPEDLYGAYGFSCQTAGGALSPQAVRAWIANLQPIQPYFQWNDDEGNHTVVIVGSYANGDLLVYDPLAGIIRQTYQSVLYALGRGTWQDTWYNIRPSNVPLA